VQSYNINTEFANMAFGDTNEDFTIAKFLYICGTECMDKDGLTFSNFNKKQLKHLQSK